MGTSAASRVVIGMDPHKRSATIEVMAADETVVGGGRFATDRDGYDEMRRYACQWPERVWAIEGCAGLRPCPVANIRAPPRALAARGRLDRASPDAVLTSMQQAADVRRHEPAARVLRPLPTSNGEKHHRWGPEQTRESRALYESWLISSTP